MTKMIVFLMLFIPSMFGFAPATDGVTCTCAKVTNVQKTGNTIASISYSWNTNLDATQYKLWYYHEESQHTSSFFYTSSAVYTFSSLAPGHYTFYFVADCGDALSDITGLEDVVQG